MLSFLKNIFDVQAAEIKRFSKLVEKINLQEEAVKKLSDKALAAKTKEFTSRLEKEPLESLLTEAFAVVREASRRTIGLRHFDVQLVAAAALFEGKIAEQKTGEGKTLSATPALYLRALAGKGAHLVTVNDYLARRDAGWMGPIFHFLGFSVGCLVHDQAFLFDPNFSQEADDQRLSHLRPVSRKEAYQADITYGTNNEFGFDYLRDNLVFNLPDKSQRGHYFAVVDEVDFALIDEARTPLIISSPELEATDKYYQFARLARELNNGIDYKVDEEAKNVLLTDHGISKVEKRLGVENLYEKDFESIHHLENALKAKELFRLNRDYVIKDGEAVIVDEFTGRLMFGRRWSAGLHQAVEAKEGVKIQQESKTLATISFQNYFRLYEVLSGMTGTAYTSREEFKKIYGLDTLVIPTYKPIRRIDHPDAIFKTQRAKYTAVANKVEELHKKGQPVLVGTTSIEKNEIVSRLLAHKGIPHQVLNAKNHEKEAGVISQAGKKGAVTVATNMAGRGVDIVLGGEPPKESQKSPPKAGPPLAEKVPAQGGSASGGKSSKPERQNSKEEQLRWQKEHEEVINLGGLFVLGTERHEARRIDNQLRGRAGRLGDPGASQFFIALDDDMMRVFGGEQIAGLMTRFNFPDDVPIENSLISRSLDQIQAKVESVNFDARRYLVEYDDVINKQREVIYKIRDKVLLWEEEKNFAALKKAVLEKVNQELEGLVDRCTDYANGEKGRVDEGALLNEVLEIIPLQDKASLGKEIHQQEAETVKKILHNLAENSWQMLEEKIGKDNLLTLGKWVYLSTIDRFWTEHLDNMEALREGISLRAYGQENPLAAYKKEAFEAFEKLMAEVDYQVSRRILRLEVREPSFVSPFSGLVTNADHSDGMGLVSANFVGPSRNVSQPLAPRPKTPGRNDLCPCGSGKKYKKCCYPKYG
ncbi:preprotein translocase subunit SecA [Candidatus Shapirobacteria bacterium]|nr:preprotein translocase subunit SecA [Candidatus Shapirobacteria bacterium]